MKKVIYIDDEATTEKMLSRFEILEKQGIEIIQVDNIPEALPKIRAHISDIHLIILDIIMPPEDYYTLEETNGGSTTGLRLLKDIRLEFTNIPVMIVSIKRRKMIDDLLKEYNVVEYLEKPISTAEIAFSINRIIA
jgi:CheY-like chemotaxis protein